MGVEGHDFLSEFAPIGFILGELGSQLPLQEVSAPLVFLARFRDNVYIFLISALFLLYTAFWNSADEAFHLACLLASPSCSSSTHPRDYRFACVHVA